MANPVNTAVDESDSESVSESVEVPGVTPSEVFAHLADPANHVSADGHPSVVAPIGATRLTGKGDRFGMRMRAGIVPYRITNTVVEFDQDRRLAWRHLGGHRWRYELEPTEDGTRVTETFDLSRLPRPAHAVYRLVFGYPDDYRANLRQSLDDLRARLTTPPS